MKAHVISLGCPKNLCDSEVIMGNLVSLGYTLTPKQKEADVIVINTCSFLKSAREESILTINKAIKAKKKGAKVYIAGCLPKLKNNLALSHKIDGIIDSVDIFNPHTPHVKATNPWTAYVKISEGCNNNCSYCLIPAIRGNLILKETKDILKEVETLAKKGVKEIIFVAQDTTAHKEFIKILERTAKIQGIRWIRIMYTHPAHISVQLIKTIAKEPKICKYIDLPMQHICDKILKKMKRGVSSLYMKRLIKKLRDAIPDIIIRTSFIVGFPGETKSEFKKLVEFIRKTKFERIGVFEYSREEGTPAAKLRGQVPGKVRKERFHELMTLQNQISKELNNQLIGKIFDVLIEKKCKNFCIGRSYMDAPEIDGSVKIYNANLKLGEFVRGKIIKASAYDLVACLT
ncbi:hypothetical protein A2310_02045 [candidate division WOR-1 bacterium RIFOXYB2_FULL_37_13]|uniref:Ribosomal protein uS12 methylthiotransferase RimO n=1 Tax=candidate division WOR-1 bacterium RIFOXYB2_FULL_37_13 TaxID=1802579 RepID=A0A1F4SDS3_UNCSA|nr:MAG: hypothetical protein A2310_02045 [candidate division WOR-1 bacterium RIFOXYB2_FULL_37_13]